MPVMVAVFSVSISLTIGGVLLVWGHRPSLEGQRNALRSYTSAAQSLAQAGGGLVQQAMKPAIGSLEEGSPDSRLPAEASDWADQMQRVHDEWQRLAPPDDLAASHRMFLRALSEYVSAARDIEAAARGSGTVQTAIAAGQAGDRLWDRAAKLLTRSFLRLGIETPGWAAASQPG